MLCDAATREASLAHHLVCCGNSMRGSNYLRLVSSARIPTLSLYNLMKCKMTNGDKTFLSEISPQPRTGLHFRH